MGLTDILSIISDDLNRVEQEIDKNIQSPAPLVYEISKYLLEGGGKRIRPAILLLCSGSLGLKNGALQDGWKKIASAAAIELIHTASLLHDDVVDEASVRRGKESSNVVWGNKPTVLVGDFLLSKALGLIQSCGNLDLIKAVTDASAKLAEGQVLEVMSSASMIETTEDVCFGIIENKTASLIESSARVGALLATDSDETNKVDAVGNYGLNLGIAFQLVDDALDYSSTEQEFGKQVGQDLVEGKMTLPLYYSIQDATKTEQEKVSRILGKDIFDEQELSFIFEIVSKYKGVDKTKDSAKSFVNKAKESLTYLPVNEFNKSLDMLADFVVERTN
ncbi:MAG TPA: polyprenyl synthetase family protein [Thermodesulfobacteriota bacterium]|jgi:octaprenyl-diphosphate synthase|nr:polyprenyl synthetase family protein [Thermodesulfobacteriota bacterium]